MRYENNKFGDEDDAFDIDKVILLKDIEGLVNQYHRLKNLEEEISEEYNTIDAYNEDDFIDFMKSKGYELKGAYNSINFEYNPFEQEFIAYHFVDMNKEDVFVIFSNTVYAVKAMYEDFIVDVVDGALMECDCHSVRVDLDAKYEDGYEDVERDWKMRDDGVFCIRCNEYVQIYDEVNDTYISHFTS